jgi:uncharacterized membrane protein
MLSYFFEHGGYMNWIDYLPEQIQPRRPRWYQKTDDTAERFLIGLVGVGLGVGLMYLLDPSTGARRRGMIRGKMSRAAHQTGTALRKTGEYSRGQTRGFFARMRSHFSSEEVSDRQLCERVRSAMGRATSHPSAIEVQANNGVVTVSGNVLRDELDGLIKTVEGVRGVERVDCALDVHDSREGIPQLQGGGRRARHTFAPMQEHWSPTTRAIASIVGGSLAACAIIRRDALSLISGAIGLAIATRGMSNMPAKRIFGVGAGRRAIDVQKTINILAPIDVVFNFFGNYDNFPYFMSNVVQVSGDEYGQSHWVVKGPAGIKVEWDAELTRFEPNECIAWKSLEGSTIANAGIIRFDTNPDGSTRVDIKLSYNPPGGALGHFLARIFGADAKSEMDQDLLRAKTTLETGQPAHDAAAT